MNSRVTRVPQWSYNLSSHVLSVDTVRLKRCLLINASSITSARVVAYYCALIKATAVFTVPSVPCHARQFKKHARKEMVQYPAVSLDILVGSGLCENSTFSKIRFSDIFGKAADNASIIEAS
jgi:hypothetical protein